jgi:hypothetical protein
MDTHAIARPRADAASLQRTLGHALGLLGLQQAAAARQLARALAELGDFALPDLDTPAPAARDAALLAPLGPLYVAHELEQAGLLRAAELIAGLFASGTIQQPLGATAGRLNDFWRGRHERLGEAERAQLLGRTFEAQAFYPRMDRLCAALAALADNADASDLRETVGVEQAGWALVDLLAARAGGMLSYAAADILGAVKAALAFMRERTLQVAFGTHDLWSLVAASGAAQGIDAAAVRRHVELAREGASILVWLAAAAGTTLRLDPASPQARSLIGAALRWRLSHQAVA